MTFPISQRVLQVFYSIVVQIISDARSEGGPPFSPKKSGKKSCSGLNHNQVILSDKSDKIREILKKTLNTLFRHPLCMRPLHDFFPLFFLDFFPTGSPSDRASYVKKSRFFCKVIQNIKKNKTVKGPGLF